MDCDELDKLKDLKIITDNPQESITEEEFLKLEKEFKIIKEKEQEYYNSLSSKHKKNEQGNRSNSC